MDQFQSVLGVIVAVALALLLVRQYRRENAKRADQGRQFFAPVISLIEDPLLERGEAAGVWMLNGRYRNFPFQLKTVADTLATRKLPSLWLMVTLPEPQPVFSTTNLMMRAAGVTSFSNFDFLPHTLALPDGFPEQATLRSDVASSPVASLMVKHLGIFRNGRGKEFLISPKGLRIVVQLAEGDRARYGVFREANFEGTTINVEIVSEIMNTLIALKHEIRANAAT